MSSHVGEIVAADTFQFEAECPRLYGAPEFGSFVRADGGSGRRVYGVVYYIATAAAETSRRTCALHMTPEELQERMPQLELVLRTCFAAVSIGYGASGAALGSRLSALGGDEAGRPATAGPGARSQEPGAILSLPPQPPEIHRFVDLAQPEEIRALSDGPDFLRMLAQATPRGYPLPVDDLIAAAIVHAAATRGTGSSAAEAFVVDCGKYVAQLFKREFDRFESIMRRLDAARAAAAGRHFEQPLVS
jgi:hypothetical protein